MMRSAEDANKLLLKKGVDYLRVLEGGKSCEIDTARAEVETCGLYDCLNFFDGESFKCLACVRNPKGPHFGGEAA